MMTPIDTTTHGDQRREERMTDLNGNTIELGQRAVLLKSGLGLKGKIGEVRAIKDRCLVFNGPGVRVTEGPEGEPHWSAWCKPHDIAVVMMPSPATPDAAKGETPE